MNYKVKKVIAEQINKKLHEKGWSAQKLARESGLSLSTIYNITKGRTVPKTHSIIAIANALNTTLGYLTGTDSRRNKTRYTLYLQKDFLRICREFDRNL